MKRILSTIGGFALLMTLYFNAGAQVTDKAKQAGSKTADVTKKAAVKTADTTKSVAQKTKSTVAPKSDEDIQKCINDGFASNAKLKDLSLSATVAGGEATLTGDGKSGGNKNTAASVAKKCGAKKVTNNITIPGPAPKSGKPAKNP
jgi:osmotically-inducible protein OsmY